MKLNLSSQIVLNKVPEQYYRPRTAVERSEITRCEKLFTDIYPKVEEGAKVIADTVETEIKRAKAAGKKCVLALGTGLSLNPIYEELIRRHKAGLSFDNVVVFNAYEYFPLDKNCAQSAINQLRQRFLDHVDVKAENIHTPDGSIAQDEVFEHCRAYEQLIAAEGGIDIAMLGIGRMGNIAANEPGSSLASQSRIILIDQTAREEMSNSFGTLDQVPPCSITMGVHTLLSAHKMFLTAWGEEKSDVVQKIVEGGITDTVPASFVQTHNDAKFVIDLAAASKLTRIVHPWLVTNCEWTDKTIRAAVVWLCQLVKKPILKLTNKDYNENGLSDLLALFGSAYNCNIKIFNDLQHTITGCSKSNIFHAAFISVARTVLGTGLTVFCSALFGYLVTKDKLRFRRFFYRAVVITMYLNAGLIPTYILYKKLHLINSFLVYILPGAVSGYYVILIKTYIESLPASLEEAAMLDGASHMRSFLSVILPLCKPILATVAVFCAVGQWNAWQDNFFYVSSGDLRVLQLELWEMLNSAKALAQAAQSGGNIGGLMAQAQQFLAIPNADCGTLHSFDSLGSFRHCAVIGFR